MRLASGSPGWRGSAQPVARHGSKRRVIALRHQATASVWGRWAIAPQYAEYMALLGRVAKRNMFAVGSFLHRIQADSRASARADRLTAG